MSGSGPIDSFVPVVMFSMPFGLSMDYLVFLVSPGFRVTFSSSDGGRGTCAGNESGTGSAVSIGMMFLASYRL